MSDDGVSVWRNRWTGFGIAGVIVAFFSQEEMAFANPLKLATLGLLLALTVILMFEVDTNSSPAARKCFVLLLIPVFAFTVFVWYHVAQEADTRLNDNFARCLEIQRDMVSVAPKRSDNPDRFQALRCRPVTNAELTAPKPKPTVTPAPASSKASPSPAVGNRTDPQVRAARTSDHQARP